MDRGRDLRTQGPGDDFLDLRNIDALRAAAARLGAPVISGETGLAGADQAQPAVRIANAAVKLGYKARPLNGVWATAPYFHNGSVLNLVELLKPAAERLKTFHVGSQEFDPENVGFKNDPNQPLFDTALVGNSNAGHEYGAALSPAERRQLLEYLKSL